MPYFEEMTEWYSESSLLLKARPTTTRVTSKYTVLKPTPSKISKRQSYLVKRAASPTPTATPQSSTAQTQTLNPEDAVTTFKLKTYDPVSGTCLKYQTTKAAEVGRLIGSLGRLGRHMAALPETTEDLSAPAEVGTGISTPRVDKDGDAVLGGSNAGGNPVGGQLGGGASGGGKKKKKGKK